MLREDEAFQVKRRNAEKHVENLRNAIDIINRIGEDMADVGFEWELPQGVASLKVCFNFEGPHALSIYPSALAC